LGERLWAGWQHTPFAVLLVTDSAEYLIGHPDPTADFTPAGYDSLLGLDIWTRARAYAPTLLATFPAVAAVPTVVVGTPQRTGKSSAEWVLTLVHEHLHQWQYSLPDYYERSARLGLSAGDSTGMWMLNYPFPYDSAPVQAATREFARALSAALQGTRRSREKSIASVVSARARLAETLTIPQNRYLEFQLWQEGVARFLEYKAAQLAAGAHLPTADYKALPDYESFEDVARQAQTALKRELETIDLGKDRRISFYPLGAAVAFLLDSTRAGWERQYAAEPFVLTSLLKPGNRSSQRRR
jgi:hypothetical protein